QPEDQSTIGGIKGTVNYLAQGFLGKDVIASGDEANKVESLLPRLAQGFLGKDVIDPKGGEAKEVEALLPRYEKGWWRIWAALLAILIAPLALIWCWRDEMHDHVSAFADWFRTKPNTNGSATSSSGGGSSNILKKLVNQTDAGDQITNHLIGDLLSRAAEMFVGTFAKLMKKY
ncbi:MAG: hypothetical protein Q7K65_01490, partial [Candidatus Buchananbacteria bacterium]|nr:hypothetical protein [Candidatus Buchananbacteria bacterium]